MVDNLSDKAFDLLKDYLCEVLKKMLDPETIVQEAACSAFSTMIVTKKERLAPFLIDIFKIIVSVLDKYSGTTLLTLYDVIIIMTENFEEHFKNPALTEELLKSVVKKWYAMIKQKQYETLVPLFEVLCALVRVSASLAESNFELFFKGSLILVEENYATFLKSNRDPNYLDCDLISKCLDMLSVLCQSMPEQVKCHPNKSKISEYIFKLLETNNGYLKHSIIALIGDLCKVDNLIFTEKFDLIINILAFNLAPKDFQNDTQKLFACINSCWTIGLLSYNYFNQLILYIQPLLEKLIKIITLPRVSEY